VTIRLTGYSDKLSAAPGERVQFFVSCQAEAYEAELVRLLHGDENPGGPGFRQEVVPSTVAGRYQGRWQTLPMGSHGEIPLPEREADQGFSFALYVQAWNPGAGEQVILAQGGFESGPGWSLVMQRDGFVALRAGREGPQASSYHPTTLRLDRWEWYHLVVVVGPDRSEATIWARQLRSGEGRGAIQVGRLGLDGHALGDGGLVLLAAARRADGTMAWHFDGKLGGLRMFERSLTPDEVRSLTDDPERPAVQASLGGSWDFSLNPATSTLTDTSAHGRHGRVVNSPTRAVTGATFSGRETCFRLAPGEYDAIHFHRDDLEDAGWEVAFALDIPDDLPSGVYAIQLRAGEDEDHLPFVVRPKHGTATASVAVLLSTMTYLTYENFTDIGKGAWREGAFVGSSGLNPYADATLFPDVYEYIDQNMLYGPYDAHVDGSATCYGSSLRPILNLRPKFRYRTLGCPARLAADLYLVDWLDRKGIRADYITDHDLHFEGSALLDRYDVVLSSSHHEYWTEPMLSSLETYLSGGGRLMYMSGNGLYGVVSVDPHKPERIEVRRWGTSWPFECPPAERYHSTTGEPGGTWRSRGRSPHRLVGVGTAGAGFDRGGAYRRMPAAREPRFEFIFEGLQPDELIGNVPSLQLRWGAAGYEFDRREFELGSPAHTQLLASSVGMNRTYQPMLDDVLWYAGGRDGKEPTDPQVAGEPHRFVRSDLAYLEYPNGGAVFAAGAIAWTSCLSAYGYDNSVSIVTENVLRRFMQTPRGTAPAPADSGEGR
jgi:N,N-dimethylformamidase